MAYDSKRDRLYIAMGGKIMMVAKASQASGDVATSEFVVLASGLGSYSTMVLDAERDELWLGGPVFDQGALVKISNISAAYGQIRTLESIRPEEKTQPVASYQIWHIRSPLLNRFAVDPVRSLIYASDGLGGVFDLASLTPARKDAATGDPIYESAVAWNNAPVRRFFNGTNVFASDVALDAARDRLYFLNSVGRQIVTIDGASAPTTPTTFTRLALPKETISIALDSKNDRLYVGGMDNDAYIFNAASTIGTGTTVPGTNVFGVAEDPPGKGLVLGISLP